MAAARDTIKGFAAPVERPSCALPIVESIPQELCGLRQWVVWLYEWRENKNSGGKWTKVPYDPTSKRRASSTDSATWGTLDEALRAYRAGSFNGIGFVFANGYGGIDLDECRDSITGKIEAWALEVMRELASYSEISPSGKGLHIFVRAKLEGSGLNRRNWHGRKIEIYDSGRFFTVTGNRLDGSPVGVEDRQSEVIALYNRVREETGAGPKPKTSTPEGSPDERASSPQRGRVAPTSASDDELIRKILASPERNRFEDFFTGGAHKYGSDSEADFAFVSLLCRWTGDDEQVARIWRLSGLDRDKLRRQDYIDRTINAARNRQTQTEQQAAPLTHREQIVCKMAAALNLSDEVFRTLLAIIAIANDRKTFKMAGWKLAAWLRTPEGFDAASWKHAAENDFDSERVKETRALESDFGSERIRQLTGAFKSIYPVLKIKEQGGGFNKDGSRRGATRYALDLRLIEEAEALAEQKLPDRLEANQLRFPLDPNLARQVAGHEARELAAIEIANRYLPRQNNEEQPEEKAEEVDPVTELYRRQERLKDRILSDVRKLAEVWQDLNDSNAEATIKKRQLIGAIDESLSSAFSPDFRLKLKRRKNRQFSQKKQGLNSNAQYELDAVTDRIDPISENASSEQRTNPDPISVKDSRDGSQSVTSDDWLTELADQDAPPTGAEAEPGESVTPCLDHNPGPTGETSTQPAQVAAFIPRTVEQELADLGYSRQERARMKPESAQRIISAQQRAPDAGRSEELMAIFAAAFDSSPPRSVACGDCGQPVVFGSERCPNPKCGVCHTRFYWKHYDEFAAAESEGFYASD
jgi:hypothetical protein